MTANIYPNTSKTDRKDALIPDPQEFDFSDTDAKTADEAQAFSDASPEDQSSAMLEACESASGRLDLFKRLTKG